MVLAVVAFLMLRSDGGDRSAGPTSRPNASAPPASPSPSPPPRARFVFRVDEVISVKTEKSNGPAADDAAVDMAGRLSTFYDAAFLDPETWERGLSDDAWTMFEDTLVKQAKRDASSLTLGDQAGGIASLTPGDTSLTITVLLDPGGRPDSAVAEVSFSASGSLQDGQAIEVTNRATYLFDLVGGSWVVIGYPTAKTTLTSVEPSAEPSGMASSTPSTGSSR